MKIKRKNTNTRMIKIIKNKFSIEKYKLKEN